VVTTKVMVEDPEQARRGSPLQGTALGQHLKTTLEGAGLEWHPEGLLGMMLTGCAAGVVFGLFVPLLVFPTLSAVGLGIAGLMAPYLFVQRKKQARLNAFEAQFPEALDFMARAVRAGHAFSVSLELLANESPEPVRTEFRKTFHEHNLGAQMEDALRSMVRRVPLTDMRFFVSAVLLQRETGGNLAEILMKLAYVIRERFRLKGQVRAASAHGRITAAVLLILPIALMCGLMIVAPGYLQGMAADPLGRWLIVAAVVGQVLGYFTMKKIINIKV
jgi:tight adherence protein B